MPGAPFGTYAQSTVLGLLTLGAAHAVFALGAILAFRWEATGGGMLVVAAVIQLLWLLDDRLFERGFPEANFITGLAVGVLPGLIIGGLLLAAARMGRREGKSGG